jgi:hypothetical protein
MAINILNAAILGEHYHQWKAKAWLRDLPFTPRWMDIMKEVFDDVNVHEFRLSIEEDMACYNISVSKNATGSKEYIVKLPKVPFNRSYFGMCTCGVSAKDGKPCQHMVVIVKLLNIPCLTQSSIMPYFWSMAHWQMQYSQE